MTATSIVYPDVELGEGTVIGDFCIIGCPPEAGAEGGLKTVIGPHSRIRSHTVIYAGTVTGRAFQTGHHACIREMTVIGDDVSVGTLTCIEHHVTIGNRVRIHSQAFVPEYTVLGDDSWIGPKATFTNARYPKSRNAKKNLAGVRVGRRAKVGANATVLPGVTLGDDCLVGAGAVVTKDVAAGAVVVGNPARMTGTVDAIHDYKE